MTAAAASPAPRLSPRAWAELILLGTIWGASFLAIKLALGEVPVFTLVAHRVVWAALILWAYVWWRALPVPRSARVWGVFLVMGLLNNVIPFTLMAWGQQFIETGLTSIFNAATAVFGVLVAAMVFADERLTGQRLAGVLIAFAGVSIAIGLDALVQFDIRSLAQLAVLAGTLSYAIAAAWARAHMTGDEQSLLRMVHYMRRDQTAPARDALAVLTHGHMDPDVIRAGLGLAARFAKGATGARAVAPRPILRAVG